MPAVTLFMHGPETLYGRCISGMPFASRAEFISWCESAGGNFIAIWTPAEYAERRGYETLEELRAARHPLDAGLFAALAVSESVWVTEFSTPDEAVFVFRLVSEELKVAWHLRRLGEMHGGHACLIRAWAG
jgi:hypothetical protein